MNSVDLNNFFFNLIPGSIFLIALSFLDKSMAQSLLFKGEADAGYEVLVLFILIIVSLFLGFISQGIVKIFRDCGLNRMCCLVLKAEYPQQYAIAEHKVKVHFKSQGIKDITELKDTELFYFMDNFLRGRRDAIFNIIHFSSRFAFWSNIAVGSFTFFLILFLYISKSDISLYFLLTIFLLIFSLVQTWKHFHAYYDVILKTFISVK